jgi:hypothetical protein
LEKYRSFGLCPLGADLDPTISGSHVPEPNAFLIRSCWTGPLRASVVTSSTQAKKAQYFSCNATFNAQREMVFEAETAEETLEHLKAEQRHRCTLGDVLHAEVQGVLDD